VAGFGLDPAAWLGPNQLEIILTVGEAGATPSLETDLFLAIGKERLLFLGETVIHFSLLGENEDTP